MATKTPKPSDATVPPADRQRQAFEAGATAFQARDFRTALRNFQEAAAGPRPEIRHSAKLHMRMCEQRIAAETPKLETADDYYHYGIALMNQHRMEEAEQHLRQALNLDGQLDFVYYGLALCRGLRGDLNECAYLLQKAIALEPRNRVAAKNDPDFKELARQSPVSELLA